jgi:GNAT superfamily N-acetyltransferase
MSISSSISRLASYYQRHGLGATVRRAQLALKRTLLADRMVVFYCDLDERRLRKVNLPTTFKVERITTLAKLSSEHFQEITSFWNPKLASRNIRERFEKGASLWLVECEDRLAGYGWTLQGDTIEPYYFPLSQDDVHFFDFHVFPHHRGRGVNPYLVGNILERLTGSAAGRAFIEAAEWNNAQLSSLHKTPFRCLGSVRSVAIFGHTFVSWTKSGLVEQAQKKIELNDQILRAARSNEQ